jgi:hypothetical protein
MRRLLLGIAPVALSLALAACGGSSASPPVEDVPTDGGLQTKVRTAQSPVASDFPATGGRTLQELADSIGGGPELGLASSVFVASRTNRVAFGVIDETAGFLYGKTAVYVARGPDTRARGPYLAPADVLLTKGPYRSRQAATEEDPFAAVYAADVPFTRAGTYSILAVTVMDGRSVVAPGQIRVVTAATDRVPDVGEPAPKVVTDTVASARGNLAAIDTRRPPARGLHEDSFADLVGRKPIALLFATPQLCQSRVCGPVVDVALQLQRTYGDRVAFIHQEVYVDNVPDKGIRPPLARFRLATEPWLFVVDRRGRITARLEGSFGLAAFEAALKTAT